MPAPAAPTTPALPACRRPLAPPLQMIIPGADHRGPRPAPEEVAASTLRCMRRCVPAAIPGIMFLSGGQVGTAGLCCGGSGMRGAAALGVTGAEGSPCVGGRLVRQGPLGPSQPRAAGCVRASRTLLPWATPPHCAQLLPALPPQTEEEATLNLDAINRLAQQQGRAPWALSFSFGRSLQVPPRPPPRRACSGCCARRARLAGWLGRTWAGAH